MRARLVLLCFLLTTWGVPGPTRAQEPTQRPRESIHDVLARLRLRQKVKVDVTGSGEITARFGGFAGDSVRLVSPGGSVTVVPGSIGELWVGHSASGRGARHAGRLGAVIGAALGGLAGATTLYQMCMDLSEPHAFSEQRGPPGVMCDRVDIATWIGVTGAFAVGAVSAVIGGAVGALGTDWRIVYPSESMRPVGGGPRIFVGPAPTPEIGAALRLAVFRKVYRPVAVGAELGWYSKADVAKPIVLLPRPGGSGYMAFRPVWNQRRLDAAGLIRTTVQLGPIQGYLIGGVVRQWHREVFQKWAWCAACPPDPGQYPVSANDLPPAGQTKWSSSVAGSFGAGFELPVRSGPVLGLEARWNTKPSFLSAGLTISP